MKRFALISLLFSFIGLANCSDDEVVEKYTLEVINGTGGGEYAGGQSVEITADDPEEGNGFDKWEGDTDVLSDVNRSPATFQMPERDIQLTASYTELDLGDPAGITIDKSTTFQAIEGFGFFGARDVWWGSESDLWDQEWGEKVINDLGLTIWRNEYYPPATENASQDADWEKQRPVVEGLKSVADAHDVYLKFIFTVWSPPASMKWTCNFAWAGDENATRDPGDVSTKNGGTLSPEKYGEYAAWLEEGIGLYEELGIDLYAISLQNEPLFSQSFNSCTYTVDWYNQLLANVVPDIKADYPDVKIFGSENMLDMEGADINWPHFYHSNIKSDPDAASMVDILAVHGYNDGVAPTSGSGLAERWTNHLEQFTKPMEKATWMTETSGYGDHWETTGDTPGALSLAQDIHAALYFGNVSAWVWWQGSELDGIGEFNLMQGTETGKKYSVSKHFYRYVRPGATRIGATSSDEDGLFVTAYEHTGNGTLTIVVINSEDENRLVYVSGNEIPNTFDMYRTTSDTDNCYLVGEVSTGAENAFFVPAKSVLTLQAGGDPL